MAVFSGSVRRNDDKQRPELSLTECIHYSDEDSICAYCGVDVPPSDGYEVLHRS